MHVLISLLYYVPHRTGYSIYVQRIAEGLAARGHRVTVLCARHHRGLPQRESIGGVDVHRLWAPIGLSRGMVMPLFPLRLWRAVQDADVVQINTPMAETALVAAIASALGKRIVATHHGDLILPDGLVNRAITRLMFAMYRFMARRAYSLVVASEDYAQHSYQLAPFRDKVAVIRPPIAMPAPQPAEVARLRARWSDQGGPLIGFAGRFVAEKRPDVLLQALPAILERHPRARVVFAGQHDIPYEPTWRQHQELVAGLRPHLEFLGSIEDPQAMTNYYAAIDVLVLPSDSDCFALVQVEAMLAGTPVVATDVPGARMVVVETGMGQVVPPRNPQAIASAVHSILTDGGKFRRPAEEIRATFDLDRTVELYERELMAAMHATEPAVEHVVTHR